MSPLHRHQLVRLNGAGWRAVADRAWDAEARACLTHWAARGLPLVVTQRAQAVADAGAIAVGLAAPWRWQRRRIALSVGRNDVATFDEFPRLAALVAALPENVRPNGLGLCDSLARLQATARVFGSRGWELVTGLSYVHARSDIDLWVAVRDAEHADAVAALLETFGAPGPLGFPRLDGELVFADGRAVAWREWLAWRSGRCRAVMTKSLGGAALVTASFATEAQGSAW